MDTKELQQYYSLQNEIAGKVCRENQLPDKVKIIAGADVAYDEQREEMIGAIVCLNTDSLEVIEAVSHKMKISFPYIPGLFSFREIPSLLAAFDKLQQTPDLLICDGHGIAHPKRVGMASHLGVELDLPTIGCAKKRLYGEYDRSKLNNKRSAFYELQSEGEVIGAALRTQVDVKPVFVSIGHKVDLPVAMEWVLRMSPKFRLPETTREADGLVNRAMKKNN